jgi:hypothetical protein
MLLSLSLTSCGTYKEIKAAIPAPVERVQYHLMSFPTVPKYSDDFYKVIPRSDQDLMLKREYELLKFKQEAQRLEREYNK